MDVARSASIFFDMSSLANPHIACCKRQGLSMLHGPYDLVRGNGFTNLVSADKAGPDDGVGKHLDCFNRRARSGKCYHRPYLGCREFPAHFELLDGKVPVSTLLSIRT